LRISVIKAAVAATSILTAAAVPQLAAAASTNFALSNGGTIKYYYNLPLTAASSKVTSAVINIHGTDRNASDYDGYIQSAANAAGVSGSTIMITPQFAASGSGSALYWSDSGWKYGDDSTSSKKFSSFAVLDEMVRKLGDRSLFPNLKQITIVGHSAGGQFVQRYAAGGAGEGSVSVPVRYVTANPSSYMYLNGYRVSSSGSWTTPTSCADYDEYRYGLKDLGDYPYMSRVGASTLTSRYPGRKVTYLLGTADTVADSDMDTTCKAMLQGQNRYQRGLTYSSFMNKYYAGNSHRVVTVSGVGHSASKMYGSATGRQAIFF
jgi:pimeloyl-ACP methyl ester carboxylesterase